MQGWLIRKDGVTGDDGSAECVLTVLMILSMPASLAMTGAEMRSGVPMSCTCIVYEHIERGKK